MVRQKPNDDKLRELVLYIATASEGDEPFGKVKLNKILFFADFEAYRRFVRSITGHEYQKLAQGPAPRCRSSRDSASRPFLTTTSPCASMTITAGTRRGPSPCGFPTPRNSRRR